MIEADEDELQREARPEDVEATALADAVHVALGLILKFTPVEAERAQAYNLLDAAYRRALAARAAGGTRLN